MSEIKTKRVFKNKYYLIRDLPDWWPKFKKFLSARKIPTRELLLWLATEFCKRQELQEDFAKWLVNRQMNPDE